MAMSTVAIHIFGDVPSAPLVGVVQVSIFRCITILQILLHIIVHIQYNILMAGLCIQDRINNWRTTALILTTIFFPAAAIWFIGKSSWKLVLI